MGLNLKLAEVTGALRCNGWGQNSCPGFYRVRNKEDYTGEELEKLIQGQINKNYLTLIKYAKRVRREMILRNPNRKKP